MKVERTLKKIHCKVTVIGTGIKTQVNSDWFQLQNALIDNCAKQRCTTQHEVVA